MPPPSYHEVVLQGPQSWTQGYLAGYLRGSGLWSGVYDAEREGFDCAPLRERVHDLFDPAEATVHLLVPEGAEATLREAVEIAGLEGTALRILLSRPLRGARFRFAFTIHSPEHAEPIRADFEQPPVGTSLLPGATFEVTRSPEPFELELKGVEHVYTLRGEGTVEGEIPAVLALYRRYREEELVELQGLHLVPAEPEP